MKLTDIIIAPIITEKAQQLEGNNQYVFVVDKRANKVQIRQAVEELYGVKVLSVNTMNYLGKVRRKYTRSGVVQGRTNNYKKAVVTLNPEDKIDFYSSI